MALTWKRLVCLVRGHKDITVIDGMTPEYATYVGGNVSLAARIKSAHRHCVRCKRDLPIR